MTVETDAGSLLRCSRHFLARIIYKYMDQDKMKALYNRAMHYYEDKKNYFAALKFADLFEKQRTDRIADRQTFVAEVRL